MNLLSNARKAVKHTAGPSVQLSCQVTGTAIDLSIRDNGCGMNAEQLERLFVPFAGSFEEGSGLGMSLVYKFIQAMGWRIEVESTVGQGTCIWIFIPRPAEEVALAPQPDQS
jgi:two-component system sensor histidine kinase PilS (NtrC family)